MDAEARRRALREDALLRFDKSLGDRLNLIQPRLELAQNYGDRGALTDAMSYGCQALESLLFNTTFDDALLAFHRSMRPRTPEQRRARQAADEILRSGSFERLLEIEWQLLRLVGVSAAVGRDLVQRCNDVLASGLEAREAATGNSARDFCDRVRAVVDELRTNVCAQSDALRATIQQRLSNGGQNADQEDLSSRTQLLQRVYGATGGLFLLAINFGADAALRGLSSTGANLSGSMGFEEFAKNAAALAGVPLRWLVTWIRSGHMPEPDHYHEHANYFYALQERVELQRMAMRQRFM